MKISSRVQRSSCHKLIDQMRDDALAEALEDLGEIKRHYEDLATTKEKNQLQKREPVVAEVKVVKNG